MIFYGWGKDLKRIAYAGIEKCPNCKNHGHFWICENSSYASLYFVKLAKWNKKQFYMCETCERGWEIAEAAKDEQIRRTLALPGQGDTTDMWNAFNAAFVIAHSQQAGLAEIDWFAIAGAIKVTAEELRGRFSDDHTAYVHDRFIDFLKDSDRPR